MRKSKKQENQRKHMSDAHCNGGERRKWYIQVIAKEKYLHGGG